MRRSVQLLLIIFVCSAAGILYLLNKPHKRVDHFTTQLVSARIIAALYSQNEAIANKKYLNKALTVSGVVGDISVNDAGQDVILLNGNDDANAVQCVFSENRSGIQRGDSILVSGFCNGYTTVVVLDDCKLFKK